MEPTANDTLAPAQNDISTRNFLLLVLLTLANVAWFVYDIRTGGLAFSVTGPLLSYANINTTLTLLAFIALVRAWYVVIKSFRA